MKATLFMWIIGYSFSRNMGSMILVILATVGGRCLVDKTIRLDEATAA